MKIKMDSNGNAVVYSDKKYTIYVTNKEYPFGPKRPGVYATDGRYIWGANEKNPKLEFKPKNIPEDLWELVAQARKNGIIEEACQKLLDMNKK